MKPAAFLPLLLLAASVAFAQTVPAVPADLALPSAADGRPLRLEDFRGEKVVLHVFASW